MAKAERVRRIYDRQAPRYDARTRSATLDGMRARLLAQAHGEVLELGVGTGATFGHYPPGVTRLTGLDLSGAMLERAQARARALPFPVRLLQRDIGDLPQEEGFDTVVSSLALCGVPEPLRVFGALRRVLRPGGQLLALEHVRPPGLLGGLSRAIAPAFDHVVGCRPDRPTAALLQAAGFRVERQEARLGGILVALRALPG